LLAGTLLQFKKSVFITRTSTQFRRLFDRSIDDTNSHAQLHIKNRPFYTHSQTASNLVAVSTRRTFGLIVSNLPAESMLISVYRWPHLPHQVVPVSTIAYVLMAFELT
jgi:hypothetical protein